MTRALPLLAACALFSIPGFAQQTPTKAVPAAPTAAAPETMPVELIHTLVYMPGAIGSSGPLNVILDSGSSMNIVSPDVAIKAGLTGSGITLRASGLGQGESEALRLFENADLHWGPAGHELNLTGQKGAILPIDYISEQIGRRTDALLGGDLFLRYTITVDYQHQSATFTPAKNSIHPAGTEIPLRIVSNSPFVEAVVLGDDGRAVRGLFFVDSGLTADLVLSQGFLEAHPGLITDSHFASAPAVRAVGGEVRSHLALLAGFGLGPFHFSHLVADVPASSNGLLANPAIAGIVGARLLSRFTITWDWSHKRLFLAPNENFNSPFQLATSGMHLVAPGPDYRAVVVDSVLKGSPASEAGLVLGDHIVAVNGNNDPALWQVLEALRATGSEQEQGVRLEVRRASGTKSVLLTPRSPFSEAP
ncbi:PDZ domain-containing protein [Silvibacterium sp.]|uniref:PDZ domain-containing protein n=1 Tax=Silvibacterium sp. TaxID=1964179 RepID=UPI0039E3D696